MKKVIVGIILRENSKSKKEYLLVSSKKDFGQYTGYYYPPGGHMEAGESKQEALKREIREELGIDVEPLEEITETKADVKDQITYWWSCKMLSDNIRIASGEIADAAFFSREEMDKIQVWPATKSFFNNFVFNKK